MCLILQGWSHSQSRGWGNSCIHRYR